MKHILFNIAYLLIFSLPANSVEPGLQQFCAAKCNRASNTLATADTAITNTLFQGTVKDSNCMPFWVNLNMGFSSFGIAGDLSLNLMRRNKLIFTTSFYQTSTESFSSIFQTESWKDFSSFNIMAGKVFSTDQDKSLISLSAGLSYTVINYHTAIPGTDGFFGPRFESKKVNTAGLPVSLKMYLFPKTAIGLNLELKTDINTERSLFCMMAGIRIGRIKSR